MSQQTKLREQLKGVRAAISETRDERAEARKARDEAKEAFAGADLSDPTVVESDDFKAAEQAVKTEGEAADKLIALQQSEATILAMLGEDVPQPGANGDGDGKAVARSRVASMLEGDQYNAVKEAANSEAKLGSMRLGELTSREGAVALISGRPRMESEEEEGMVIGSDEKTGAIPADRRGIVTPLLKPLTLLDLIPSGTTDSNNVEYVQVTALPEGAKEVAEGEPKPRLTLTTKDATAPVATIAGYVKLKKQALEDVAGLGSLISLTLPYEVKRRLESQLLSGTGENGTLKGLLKTAGIGAPAFVAGDNTADAILRAITTIVLSDGDPNFVALHPSAWEALLLMREVEKTEKEGEVEKLVREGAYLYGTPASLQSPTIWGLTITKNRVVPQATPLVGDANGASILVKSGLKVLVSDNDGDDFTRNRVTVLAEMRCALPVWRPASFAVAATEE